MISAPYLVGIFAISAVLTYLYLVWRAAKMDVQKTPRKDMYICETHGPMPVESTVVLLEGDFEQIGSDGRKFFGPMRSCPVCFGERIRKANK